MSDNEHGAVIHSWTFDEFDQHQRNKSWYIWALVIIGVTVVASAMFGNFLFSLIVVIGALLLLLNHRTNRTVSFSITEDGLLINDRFYDYRDLRSFFIIYQPPEVKRLYFDPRSVFSPRIPVTLTDQNPVEIRETLLTYLDEDLEQEDEPLADQISRFFKL